MNKNKKLIALVAAIAMIFTMLSSFTFASAATSADVATGLTLDYATTSDEGTEVTITIGYKGITSGVGSASVEITGLPSQVTKVETSTAIADTETINSDNLANGTIIYANSAVNNEATEGTIRELKLTLSSPLSKTADIALGKGTTTYIVAIDKGRYTTAENAPATMTKIEAVETTIEAPKAPKTADSDRGDIATDPTPDPNEPTPLPPVVTIEQGLTLDVEKASDTVYNVTIGYKGITSGVGSASVEINGLPSTATKVETSTAIADTETINSDNLANGTIIYANSAVNTEATDGTIRTLVVTLSKALTDDVQISIGKGTTSYIVAVDKGRYTTAENAPATMTKINAANANLEASSEEPEEPTVVDTIAVKDIKAIADADVSNEKIDETTGDSNYYIVANVTVDDQPANYGDDFVAKYGDKELTEAQYKNLINGHFDAPNLADIDADSIEDVINNLAIVAYNKGVNVKLQLADASNDNAVIAEGEDSASSTPGTTPTQTTPAISVKSSTTSVTAGEGTVVKVYVDKITNPNTDGKLTVTISDGALDLVTGSGITFVDSENADSPVALKADGVTANEIEVGSASDKYIKFVGASKGSITFTFNYSATGEVSKDTVTAKAQEKKITIKAASDNNKGGGSSSDSKNGGGGAIASGLVDTGSTGGIFGFDDMGDASWATEAVNALSARKIVSGVGDNKFDPNGALTRAAYAQMLVNAIGHSQDSADTEFADVPTDAWFYHNVAVAAQLGIVSGYGDGNFGPYDLITREQMALMTQKAAVVMQKSLVGANAGTFTDDADIADWSRDAVYALANAGIINGMGDGTFAPKANATRAQAAVIIYNTFVK